MKVTALAPWFGSNRMLAENVGAALEGCSWVGVPFAGGMCELAYIKARTLMVNDLHELVINLANVVACPKRGPALVRRLRRVPFHPWALEVAQRCCATYGRPPAGDPEAALNFAEAYFICAWMARNGKAGTKDEFKAGMSIRWEAGGGDSAKRFRSATESLSDWRKVLSRATFSTETFSLFLKKCKDADGHGLYCDPPFPGPGDAYFHTFANGEHGLLARALAAYQKTRVVCRFYDTPLIRELYPESLWQWNHLKGRDQVNAEKAEVLLVRNREVG